MSGFSPEWLALREPVDHRSRDQGLARKLAAHLAGLEVPSIVDLGCGSGSNLRATAPLLGPRQHWTLVDHDRELIGAAMGALMDWADDAKAGEQALELSKAGKRIDVVFRHADLAADLDGALGAGCDLVTASALFDLASSAFMERFATAVAARRAAFYTVLTYDGRQEWTPAHDADAALLDAFHAHQQTDKGLGPAAGPRAASDLAGAFRKVGYRVEEADSPWMLGNDDAGLIADLAQGFADAAAETGRVDDATIASWRAIARTGAVVGHKDTLALPA
jgi:hypothetical protein